MKQSLVLLDAENQTHAPDQELACEQHKLNTESKLAWENVPVALDVRFPVGISSSPVVTFNPVWCVIVFSLASAKVLLGSLDGLSS